MNLVLNGPVILALSMLACSCHGQTGKDTLLWKWSADSTHHNSIVQVACNGGTGTGVIIALDKTQTVENGKLGFCLTAYHVVADDDGKNEVAITFRGGRKAKNCRVVAHDEQADVALIHVWIPNEVEPAKLAQKSVDDGDLLEFAGLGGGSDLSCCIRHFNAAASPPSSEQKIYADATLLAGDSGGPVFNDSGEVVGVISGGWFWYDGGVRSNNQEVGTTWPARASNLSPIQEIISKVDSTVTIMR